jgi:hypothetical protein
MMGAHWEYGKKPQKNPFPAPPKRKKLDPYWLHVEPSSHWLHESFISKTVCHHFWRGLMAGSKVISVVQC